MLIYLITILTFLFNYNIIYSYFLVYLYNLLNYNKINYLINNNKNNLLIISDNFWEKKGYLNINNIVDIDDEQTFIEVYNKFDSNDDLDIIIHSKGGFVSSSDAINNILLLHEGIINIYIPFFAYSAASMIVLVADNIYMNKYSLLSTVDPQVPNVEKSDSDKDEDDNYIPAKSIIDLKEDIEIDKDNYNLLIKYYESNLLYIDGKRNLKRILSKKYKRRDLKKIIEEFASGKYPHFKQFNIDELREMGISVNTKINKNIKDIFNIYLNIDKNFNFYK